MCAISSLTSTFAISSPDEFLSLQRCNDVVTLHHSFCSFLRVSTTRFAFVRSVVFDDFVRLYSESTGGAVAQQVKRWTCDQQVVGSNPTRDVTTLGKLFTPSLCASVTKQYNLVPAQGR